MAETVNSAGDDRTRNNVMRHEYRILNSDEKELMRQVKDAGVAFLDLVDKVRNLTCQQPQARARSCALAATNAEQAVMWAVKGLTEL